MNGFASAAYRSDAECCWVSLALSDTHQDVLLASVAVECRVSVRADDEPAMAELLVIGLGLFAVISLVFLSSSSHRHLESITAPYQTLRGRGPGVHFGPDELALYGREGLFQLVYSSSERRSLACDLSLATWGLLDESLLDSAPFMGWSVPPGHILAGQLVLCAVTQPTARCPASDSWRTGTRDHIWRGQLERRA